MTESSDPILEVACPICGSLPGEKCKSVAIEPVGRVMQSPHSPRAIVCALWMRQETQDVT